MPRVSPIFYPVLNLAYAEEIARNWNTNDPASGLAGFVTQFAVPDSYAGQFEVRVVGAARHQELWVPAEQLAEFNLQIQGPIQVVRAFYGPGCRAEVDPASNLPTSVAARFAAA